MQVVTYLKNLYFLYFFAIIKTYSGIPAIPPFYLVGGTFFSSESNLIMPSITFAKSEAGTCPILSYNLETSIFLS